MSVELYMLFTHTVAHALLIPGNQRFMEMYAFEHTHTNAHTQPLTHTHTHTYKQPLMHTHAPASCPV